MTISLTRGLLIIAVITLAAACDARLGSSAQHATGCTQYGGYATCPIGDADPGTPDADVADDDASTGDDAATLDAATLDAATLDAALGDDAPPPDAALPDAEPDAPVCDHETTDLSDLIEGLTELGCDTPIDVLHQILAELERLRPLVCDGPELCDGDRDAIIAALQALADLPAASACADPDVQQLIDAINFTASELLACTDDCLDTNADGTCDCDDADGDGECDCVDDDEDGVCDCVDTDNDGICDDDDPDPTGTCGEVEWDRLGPPPDVGGDCTLITATGYSWSTTGDVAFGDFVASSPGASIDPFSSWERPYNDSFQPLWPAYDLLDNFGLSPAQIGYLHAYSGTYQLYGAVALGPLQPQLMAADHIVIMYGRANASAIYVDEAEASSPTDRLYWLDYEYTPHRDSIRILDCDADELIGSRTLGIGDRVAVDPPWTPYISDQPGAWVAVLACSDAVAHDPPPPPPVPPYYLVF
jgi:hypothetical protein